MHGYVLTIDPPDGPRRRSVAQELSRISFPWEFVEGVRTDAPIVKALYSPWKNLVFQKRSLAPAEIACYAGHRAIWEKIVSRAEPYAVVFEDDAKIVDCDKFAQALSDLTSGQFDLVKLFDLRPKPIVMRSSFGSTALVVHKMIAASTCCYLISREAASRLLSRRSVYRAVDEDFSYPWEFGITIWSVYPNPVIEGQFGSAIEGARLSSARNKLRSLYGVLIQGIKQIRMRAYLARSAGSQRRFDTVIQK